MFKRFLLVIFVLTTVSSFSQDNSTYISSGAKAVLFSFSGLANLGAGNYEGGAGAKFFISPEMALRAGLQFSRISTTTPANPTPSQVGLDGSFSEFTFGLAAAMEYHLTVKRVSPFFGAGVSFSSTSNERKNAVSGPAPQYQNTTKNQLGSGAGTAIAIFGLMGVEYFVTDGVSLSAEYRIGYSSLSASDEEWSTTAPNVNSVTSKGGSGSSIGLSSAGVLTLAIYF